MERKKLSMEKKKCRHSYFCEHIRGQINANIEHMKPYVTISFLQKTQNCNGEKQSPRDVLLKKCS